MSPVILPAELAIDELSEFTLLVNFSLSFESETWSLYNKPVVLERFAVEGVGPQEDGGQGTPNRDALWFERSGDEDEGRGVGDPCKLALGLRRANGGWWPNI
jgi:hypothetical protein